MNRKDAELYAKAQDTAFTALNAMAARQATETFNAWTQAALAAAAVMKACKQ